MSMKADIGDHIEYYYLDTEEQFGCLIESGSGHAIDFVKPAQVYPQPGAEPGPSPISGITYPITQVSVTVRDLEAKMQRLSRGVRLGPVEDLRGRRQEGHARLRVEGQAGASSTCAGPRRWSAISTSS